MNSRNFILLSALLVTVWLAWRAPSESNTIALTERVKNTAIQTSQPDAAPVFVMQNRHIAPSQFDLFDAQKPLVLKKMTTTTAKSHAPVLAIAPPLPFKWIGRMQVGEGSQTQLNQVLLNVNDEVTPVAIGDILLGQYQVQAIQNNASGTQVQFLYLPLKQTQTLNALTIN